MKYNTRRNLNLEQSTHYQSYSDKNHLQICILYKQCDMLSSLVLKLLDLCFIRSRMLTLMLRFRKN